MNIIEKKTDELIPYINNPRNNDEAVDKVAASIKEFGWKVPVVITTDNVIVTGHTRLKAAKKLGLETVPCIIADDLTESQIKAFRLADNKVAEFSEWDFDKLTIELEGLTDIVMDDFGFDFDPELFEKGNTEVEEQDIPEETEKRCKKGDIWELGGVGLYVATAPTQRLSTDLWTEKKQTCFCLTHLITWIMSEKQKTLLKYRTTKWTTIASACF